MLTLAYMPARESEVDVKSTRTERDHMLYREIVINEARSAKRLKSMK